MLLLGLLPLAAQVADPDEYDKVISTILCDCSCHPQSVKDCSCGRSDQMRETIRSLVAGDAADGRAAMTADAVIARYVAEQGEQIRIAPTSEGFNLVAWLGPFVALFGGGVGLVLLLRRWLRRQEPVASTPPAETAAEDEPYLRRLREKLEEMR